MNKIYMAGPLFNEAEVAQRIKEYELLKEVNEEINVGLEIFTPILAPQNDKSKLPTSQDIFKGDEDELMESAVIFADLSNEDAGVMMELGMVLRRDREIQETYDNIVSQLKALNVEQDIIDKVEVPVKGAKIYPYLSDIRIVTAGRYEGKYVPFGSNQFVIGGLEEYGFKVFYSYLHALEAYKADQLVK